MSPPRFAGGRDLGEAWRFIAYARSDVYRRGLDALDAAARAAGREPERRAAVDVVIAAAAVCRREIEHDPCIAPLPQSEVALGRALATLRPVSPAPCGRCAELEEWLSSLARAYGTLLHDIAATRYRPSRKRKAVMDAAHALEVGDGAGLAVVEAIRRLDRAGRALDKYRLTVGGISAHAGLGRVVDVGQFHGRRAR